MTAAEIMQARVASLELKWEIEDLVRYGSPANTRMVGEPNYAVQRARKKSRENS